jgi:hypothetical protein
VSLGPVSYADLLATRASWSLADFIVAAGVFLAASMLFFPAISNSRNQAQLAMCRNNLRQIGVSLSQFSDLNGGYFPKVATSGNLAAAGVYAPQLMEAGLLTDSKQLLCPSSPLKSQGGPQFRVPKLDELIRARGRGLIVLQRQMGGSYGYNLGYVADGRYHATRNRGRTYFAILSDAPSFYSQQMTSRNHGGCGQNVLFESGTVKYLKFEAPSDLLGDDVFHSDRGLVEAGRSPDDAVIGGSATPPLLLWTNPETY